jgi:SAM-dependent methyltransferase
VHAHDRRIDHLHRRIMSSGQRLHDPVPDACPPPADALDLGCGPGSLLRRMLDRFPHARSLAVDLDPVLLTMRRQVHGSVGGRLTWVDADLCDPNWSHPPAVRQVDAVLSTTALHWLPCNALARLYHQIGSLVREGGVFLNGDTFRFGLSTRGADDLPRPRAALRLGAPRRVVGVTNHDIAHGWISPFLHGPLVPQTNEVPIGVAELGPIPPVGPTRHEGELDAARAPFRERRVNIGHIGHLEPQRTPIRPDRVINPLKEHRETGAAGPSPRTRRSSAAC